MSRERPHDREVAGIRCTGVLEVLSDYLDGDLDADTVRRVDAHLAGCDWCERFGGDFRDAITALRGHSATRTRRPRGGRPPAPPFTSPP